MTAMNILLIGSTIFLVFSLLLYSFGLHWHSTGLNAFGIGGMIIAAVALAGTLLRGVYKRYVEVADDGESQQVRDVRWTKNFVLAFVFAGGLLIVCFSLQHVLNPPWQAVFRSFGAGGLLGFAALLCGAVVGFLFGVPRANRDKGVPKEGAASDTPAAEDQKSRSSANTNLEEISDWLTKIIVGLGLTKLAKIPLYVERLTYFVTHSPNCPGGNDCLYFREDVAFAIMAGFGACGFLMGYLLTRLFLQGAFSRAVDPLTKLKLEAAGDPPPPPPNGTAESVKPSTDLAVTPAENARALKVQQLNLPAAKVRAEVRKLADRYNALRLTMQSGFERTSAMGAVASQMKLFGTTLSDELLKELTKSSSAGERLAAVISLELSPRPDYLEWLKESIKTEQPFIGYHAALALQAAVRALDQEHHSQLRSVIAEAQKLLEGKKASDRYQVLTSALEELDRLH